MISLIICSRKIHLNRKLIENIDETIGIPYEIVVIDNSTNQNSICSAYNLGASKSKFDILCFVHDDVAFHTKDWGSKILNHLINENCGLIGVAGSTVKSKKPSPWWVSNFHNFVEYNRYNVIQHRGTKGYIKREGNNPFNEIISKVVVLDGFFLCSKKEVWQNTRFDEQLLNGFHGYDTDICLACHTKGLSNYAVHDIDIEHFSAGSLDLNWLKTSMLVHHKWRNRLPLSINTLTTKKEFEIEYQASKNFFINMVGHSSFCLFSKLKYFFQCLLMKPFPIIDNLKLLKILIRSLY